MAVNPKYSSGLFWVFSLLSPLHPSSSPAFFPFPEPSPFRTSFLLRYVSLTSRCLTYFLRLLQCSLPLYHENTHTLRFSITLLPQLPPVPAPSLSRGSRIAPAGPAQDAPLLDEQHENLHMYNQANKERRALKCYTLLFFMLLLLLFLMVALMM